MNTNLHTCTQTDSGIDCTACKLAQICNDKKGPLPIESNESNDDYSISEELTGKGNDFSILYLVIAAAATLACVVLFTYLLK